MVDNNEQWNEEDFSEDEFEEEYGDEPVEEDSNEYSEDEYGDEEYSEEYQGYDENDDFKPKSSGASVIILVGLIVVIASAVAGYFVFDKFFNPTKVMQQAMSDVMQTQDMNMSSTSAVADDFFREAGGNPDDMMSVNFGNTGESNVLPANAGDVQNAPVATVSDVETPDLFGAPVNDKESQVTKEETPENPNMIKISYNEASRMNPFKPFELILEKSRMAQEQEAQVLGNIPYEIVEPPSVSEPNEHINALLTTQISGILYDEESPSAIVSISGKDQFVKIGDKLNGYEIRNITKNQVEVAYENNTYVAAVGELFTKGTIDLSPAVDNLENKFAGRRNVNNNTSNIEE